jgi:hypothetical protein
MKKLFFFTSILLAVISCDKPADIQNKQDFEVTMSEITDIETDYSQRMKEIFARNNGNKSKNEKKGKRKLNWDKAYSVYKGTESRVIIPFELENEIYTKLADSSMTSYSKIAKFIVSGTKGHYQYEIATYFPDLESLSDKTKKFSGRVVIEDLNGDFIKGYKYKNDKITRITVTEKNARTAGWVKMCDVTDWYSCMVIDGRTVGCTFDYTEYSNCEEEYDDEHQDKWSVDENGNYYVNWIACVGCGPSSNIDNSAVNAGLFKLSMTNQMLYPRFTLMAKGLYEYVKANQKVLNALKAFSGLSESQILDKIKFGQGPTIVIKELNAGTYGSYSKQTDPNSINVSATWVQNLEFYSSFATTEAVSFLLAVTVLHEFVHWSRDANGMELNNFEYGVSFEQQAYGVEISRENAIGAYTYRFFQR